MKNPWVIIGVFTIVLFGGAFWYSAEINKQANEGVVIEPNIKGNPDAEVVLVEYADFECPACGQFHPVVKEIVEDYGDQLRYEYRHFPLVQIHAFAEPAARAAEAAGQQGKFFEYHDYLFENQSRWIQGQGNPPSLFVEAAEAVGLDMDQFTRQQRSSLIRDKIRSDLEEGLERGVASTPTFFLNGKKLESGVDLNTIGDLRLRVEEALGVNDDAGEGDGTATSSDAAAPATPTTPAVQFGV